MLSVRNINNDTEPKKGTKNMIIKVVREGQEIARYNNVRIVEIKWIDDFNWYGAVLHLENSNDTATFQHPIEIYRYDELLSQFTQI